VKTQWFWKFRVRLEIESNSKELPLLVTEAD